MSWSTYPSRVWKAMTRWRSFTRFTCCRCGCSASQTSSSSQGFWIFGVERFGSKLFSWIAFRVRFVLRMRWRWDDFTARTRPCASCVTFFRGGIFLQFTFHFECYFRPNYFPYICLWYSLSIASCERFDSTCEPGSFTGEEVGPDICRWTAVRYFSQFWLWSWTKCAIPQVLKNVVWLYLFKLTLLLLDSVHAGLLPVPEENGVFQAQEYQQNLVLVM